MRIVIIIKCILLFFISISCKETVVEYIEAKKGFVRVSRNKVEIGEKVSAHFMGMDSIYVYSVTLNEKKVTYKQINDSTVTLIVPYTKVGNDIGNFIFYCWMNTNSFPDTVLVSNQINYKDLGTPITLYIKWSETEKVTEYESKKYDVIEQKGWEIKTSRDTIKMTRRYTCHDECGITETLVFIDNGNDQLPKFLYATFDRTEMLKAPIHIKIDRGCKIMIDTWNNNKFYSGTFSSADYSWIFWCKK